MRHPSTVTSGQAGVYDAAGNLTQWHDMDGGTVTSYAYYPWGQMRSLSRAGFERQYATTAGGQRVVTRDPGTGRLTVTLRGLDTKVRRVVEQHSGQWTWVKDSVTGRGRSPFGAAHWGHLHGEEPVGVAGGAGGVPGRGSLPVGR